MNIKKFIFLLSFFLINLILIICLYKSNEFAQFILLFLVAEITICELVLRTKHKELLRSIRLMFYVSIIIIMRLMDSLKFGAIAIGILITYSIFIDYSNSKH